MSKIGSVETIEMVLNFDQKYWPDFVDQCSYLEDLLEEHISPDDSYFVPSWYWTSKSTAMEISFFSSVFTKKETWVTIIENMRNLQWSHW